MKTDVALERGIYPRLVDSMGSILAESWRRAIAAREIVGLCRRCEGLLFAVATEADEVEWFTAECNQCWAEMAAPNGYILRRSARHREMPAGAWDRRTKYMASMKTMGRTEA